MKETGHKNSGTVQEYSIRHTLAIIDISKLCKQREVQIQTQESIQKVSFSTLVHLKIRYTWHAWCKQMYKPRPGTIEVFLDKYSREHKPVTFLQVGANDGFINDPLHKFIKRDNWNGVLLEPQPDVFNDFLVKLHRKRPGDYSHKCCS
ncbi:MAG: hypothetical protein MZV63_50430 [Marinilabiliales bacterium]|nr:hypothetical protein [Marinilabiliales bacterium]